MKLKTPILLLCISLFFGACTIEQTYYFKEDFSGDYTLRFDLSSVAAMGGDSLGTDTIFSEEALQEMSAAYSAVPGISNASSTYSDNVLESAFAFSGINSLNAAMENSQEGSESTPALYTFVQKGKMLKLIVNRKKMEAAESEEMAQMGDMVNFNVTLGFERKIKKLKSQVAQWNKENNTITIEFPLKDFLDPKKNLNAEIRFK
jgi:hypothetical protein